MKRATLAVALLASACADTGGARISGSVAYREACAVADGASLADLRDARFQAAQEFGREQGQELSEIWGVDTAPTGEVFVFSAGNTEVLKLDSELRLVETIGREGRGPGEFVYQRVGASEWLAVTDSSFFVLDLRALSKFRLDGEFDEYVTTGMGMGSSSTMGLGALRDRIIYAKDVIDRATGARAVETWQVTPGGSHTLIRVDSMPPLPRSAGRLVRGIYVYQAEPLWVLHGQCAFISDGAGDWILRVDLNRNLADTLYLPERAIPEITAEDERAHERLRRAASRVGASVGSPGTRPTARLRWQEMETDQAGRLWLAPWRPGSMRHQPFSALVIDPGTGATDSVIVSEFPEAFLPDGGFVSLLFDDSMLTAYLQRFIPTQVPAETP